jgi:hypothetical protein
MELPFRNSISAGVAPFSASLRRDARRAFSICFIVCECMTREYLVMAATGSDSKSEEFDEGNWRSVVDCTAAC